MLLTVIIFVLTLLTLVLVHELGHFLVAKKFRIKVLEFGFGIPPRIWGKKVGETLVSVNWLPIGGFVHLLGEDEVNKKVLEDKRSFASQKVYKRILVVIAGVIMNLLLAWLLFYIVLGFSGFKTQFPLISNYQFAGVEQNNESVVIVEMVAKDSPASLADIKTGERVLAVNGESILGNQDLVNKLETQAGNKITLTLSKPDKTDMREVAVTPRKNPPKGEGALGVTLAQFNIANISYEKPVQKLFAGPIHSWNLIAYSGKVMGGLISLSFQEKNLEPVSSTVAGPVGITSLANTILTQTKHPLLPYLDFVAYLSLNLAVINIIPFPALDGGRLFFLALEGITRKKVHPKIESWVHTVGMVILILLIILITFSDISKIAF